MYTQLTQSEALRLNRKKRSIKLILSVLMVSLTFGILCGLFSQSIEKAHAYTEVDLLYIQGDYLKIKHTSETNNVRSATYSMGVDVEITSPSGVHYMTQISESDNDWRYDETYYMDLRNTVFTRLPEWSSAKLTEEGLYEIYFYSEGSSAGEWQSLSVYYYLGTPIELPPDPTFEGYEFAGWYYDEGYETVYAGEPIYAETDLYAGWKVIKTDELEGYSFVEWCLDDDLTVSATDKVLSLDTPLYPKFIINSYSITYYVDGVIFSSQTKEHFSFAENLAFVKVGHNFKGWFTDVEFTNVYDFENESVIGELNLYAKFEIVILKVSFYVGNKLHAELTLPYGSVLGEQPEVVELARKYNMTGFYSDTGLTTSLRADTAVTNDLTLYASVDVNSGTDVFKGLGIGAGTVGIIAVVIIVLLLLRRR